MWALVSFVSEKKEVPTSLLKVGKVYSGIMAL